jgi:hypothetical protein
VLGRIGINCDIGRQIPTSLHIKTSLEIEELSGNDGFQNELTSKCALTEVAINSTIQFIVYEVSVEKC